MSRGPSIDRNRVISLWKSGLTTSEIAEKVGCAKESARSVLGELNLEPNAPGFDYSKMWALFDAGWDILNIAVEFSIEPSEVIARMLKDYKRARIKYWTDEDGNLVLLRRRGHGIQIVRREIMITDSIEKLSKRYALKIDIKVDNPDYFDEGYFTALDDGITALQLQNKLKQILIDFKIHHGPEDKIEAREVVRLLESLCMEK